MDQGLPNVFERNLFYKSQHDALGLIVIILSILFFTMIGFTIYQANTYPSPRYFPTSADGRPIPLIPLDNPLYDNDFIFKWATQAVTSVYSYDFVTFRKSFQDAKQYFTFKGYTDFLIALKESNNLEAVKARKQIVTSEVTGPPVLKFAGLRTADGPYSWDMEIPLTITYQNSETLLIKQRGIASVSVERGSTLNTYNALAISQMIFREEY